MAENRYVIYRILNTVTGQSYVGLTCRPKQRKWDHFCRLKSGTHHSSHLQRAYNKYGRKVFRWEVLQRDQSLDDALQAEVDFIEQYDSFRNGYNMTEGGEDNNGKNEKPFIYEGKRYRSRVDAARALGISLGSMYYRLKRGYTSESDLLDMKPRKIVWCGVEYESLAAAERATGINRYTLRYRIEQGYTCPDDLRPRSELAGKSCVWDGKRYPNVSSAARDAGVGWHTMARWLELGYTCRTDVENEVRFKHRGEPIEWCGEQYSNITQAARELGIDRKKLSQWLKLGYTCDSDVPRKRRRK